VSFYPRDRRRNPGSVWRSGARNTGNRHVIDKARRVGENLGQPLVVRCGRRQPDEVHSRFQRRKTELLVFLGRQVHDNEAVDTGRLGIDEKTFVAVNVDRVVIAHQHDGRFFILFTKFTHELERPSHALTRLERAQARGLDRRAVGHRVGEGHSELDHIGSRLRQSFGNGERGIVVRIACHDESHQRGTAFFFQGSEALLDSRVHRFLLSRKASTDAKSLSPRPERLTTIR
jgi:hypothetical protein